MTKVIANYILLEIICVSKLSQVLGKFYFIFVVNYQHLCCPTNTLQLLNILFPTKSALFVINVELDKGISNHWDQKKKKNLFNKCLLPHPPQFNDLHHFKFSQSELSNVNHLHQFGIRGGE